MPVMTNQEKGRSVTLRHRARAQNYELYRSRSRDPESVDYGLWRLADMTGTRRSRTRLTLDEVELFLNGDLP